MLRGFQADAFQNDAFLTTDVAEEAAFQADAFQNDAFQVVVVIPPAADTYRMFFMFG